MIRTTAWTFPLLFSVILVAGCRSTPELDDPTTYTVIIGQQEFYTEPVQFRDDIGLHARAVRNSLILSWRNNRAGEIMVRPEDLALIAGQDRDADVYPFNMTTINMSRFQPLILKGGQAGVMVVEMRLPITLTGTRVAYFNRRQDLMVRAEVE